MRHREAFPYGFRDVSNRELLRQSESTTDQEGRFTFDELSTDAYNLAVSSPAGEMRQENVEVRAGSPEVELRLPSGESVIVRVVNADDQAIEGAKVRIERSVNTGGLELLPGQRRITVDVSGDIVNLGAATSREECHSQTHEHARVKQPGGSFTQV